MFAIIESGGKQYKVAKNDVLELEKLPGEEGSVVELGYVLLINDEKGVSLGNPIEGAYVSAEIISQERGGKVIVFKKKRRQNYRRKKGHRQYLTVVRIKDIKHSGASKAVEPKKKTEPKAKAAVEKAPAKKKTAASKEKTTAKKTAKKK